MHFPALTDVILAVATQWRASPLGIVRLSGRDAFAMVAKLGLSPPDARGSCWTGEIARFRPPQWTENTHGEIVLPVTAYWFRAPRSYTGQDVVELHTVGNLPLLGSLCAYLVEHGARRALPGEFTARAYWNGRMSRDQVAGVLRLMQAEDAAGLRAAARDLSAGGASWRRDLAARLTRLLALVEAGIDFVEEEDVQILTPADACRAIDELTQLLDRRLAPLAAADTSRRAGTPHVALVGLPNAGKSTLFNALLGRARAIVSPVPGTTRDVLCADLVLGGIPAVLQDCAGCSEAVDELELATHVAARRTAQQADLVLWVHALPQPWSAAERAAYDAVPRDRRLLVATKHDLVVQAGPPDLDERSPGGCMTIDPVPDCQVSALTQTGMTELRGLLRERLKSLRVWAGDVGRTGALAAVRQALGRARALAAASGQHLAAADLIAIELREALLQLGSEETGPVDEAVLEHIFKTFCVGK